MYIKYRMCYYGFEGIYVKGIYGLIREKEK